MKEIGIQELKQIQLDILTRVHDFCLANDINYSLSSGTLIGAVRHSGYIPWDDDIDIYMMRPEFEKFERLFSDTHLRIMSPSINKDCIYPYGKVYDSRTVMIENVDYSMDSMGVNIDVFVIDSVPDDEQSRKSLFRKNKILEYIIIFKTVKYRKGRSLFKNLGLLFGKLLFFPIPLKRVINAKYKLSLPYNPLSKDICNVLAGNGINACFPKDVMDRFVDIVFEKRKFKCMENYDQYLRVCYGDYMQLPPVEKRVSTHTFKAFWK